MKKYTFLSIVPVLALVVAGCSSPVAMQSTEYDDMYYSSSDQTVYTQPAETTQQRYAEADQPNTTAPSENTQPLREGEMLNPEYSGNATGAQAYADDEYYDGRSYEPRDNWYRPNYSFVDPYWGSAYVPRYNPYSAFSYSPYYNSYNAYDPFFSPYGYDPYFSRPYYGSGLSFSMGFAMGWGSAIGRRPYYNPWYPYNNYYNGYYGGGYNNYYGGNSYYNGYYDRPIVLGKPVKMQRGPRESRGAVVTGDAQRANGRTERSNAISSERQNQQRVQDGQPVGRPSRRTAPDNTIRPVESQAVEASPARPSRRSRSGNVGNEQNSRPATIDRSQQQQQAQPVRERRIRESAPARESVAPVQRQQPVRRQQPVQRETRTYESRPSRTYETQSSPSRSFEPSRSSSPSPANNSSGGGRPSRGRGN